VTARCPLCGKTTRTFLWGRGRIYEHHYATGRTNAAVVCDASGWLVEDDELIDPPRARKVRSDAGVAQKAER